MPFYPTHWPVQLLWIRRLGVFAWFPIHYAKSHSMEAGYNLFSGDHQTLIRLSHAHFTPDWHRTAETFGDVEMERYLQKKRAGSDCMKCISTKSGNRMRRKRLHCVNAHSDVAIHVMENVTDITNSVLFRCHAIDNTGTRADREEASNWR
ncbi:hypothetical protein C8J56DRAFT_931566 [Mycena floridula]|nr:hypothetical protein C8J56DRAFT_987151 [Mycena floridula]KAJ7591708.1 hypothetical protein C8J56DRAFT_931566 [Mycena floridula]